MYLADLQYPIVVISRKKYLHFQNFNCKDTNDFLNKLRSLPKLPGNFILCTVDLVGLYPNILQEEGLSALRKRLDNQMKKYISSDTPCNLAEVELKNNAFKFGKKALKKKREIAIGTKFAPPYSTCLWWSQKSKFSEKQNLNRIFGGGILMTYFPFGRRKTEVLYRQHQ